MRLVSKPQIRRIRVEENKGYGTWAIVELWHGGVVRSPYPTKAAAIETARYLANYYGYGLEIEGE